MRFCKLRIGWSVLCGLACILLIAVWVRSYWTTTYIATWYGQLSLQPGAAELAIMDTSEAGVPVGTVIHVSSEAWIEDFQEQVRTYGMTVRGDHWSRVWGTFNFQRYCILPYWFLTVIFAVLSGAPWLRRQFSVRTLLIATTLVALVLGLVVYTVRK
jgi:hypothetical protein